MKHLFDNEEMYTEDAKSLDRLTKDALDNLFMRFVDEGYSTREIAQVMRTAIEWVEIRARTLKLRTEK